MCNGDKSSSRREKKQKEKTASHRTKKVTCATSEIALQVQAKP